jgi:hypothetical protein
MSKYNVGETTEWGWRVVKRDGQVEMWHNPKSGSYEVFLYEHVQQYEDVLLHATRFTLETAESIFDTVVSML